VIAIRDEAPGDEAAIAEVTTLAFAGAPHSDGTEAAIVARLRADGDLALSLVAEEAGRIVGHAAFSPVTIEGAVCGWFGLGPVSVLPERQGEGVGSGLIDQGLERLRDFRAIGCVVLGDSGFYGRFGFMHDPRLWYPGPPAEYLQRLIFTGAPPTGTVAYARGFGG
jgi:putative acetyltransferase